MVYQVDYIRKQGYSPNFIYTIRYCRRIAITTEIQVTRMHELNINPDGSERLEYTLADMPVRACNGRLRIFQNYAAGCHWHEDFEILAAQDGEMDYFVNGTAVHLKKGDAMFVNARRLHYGYSAAGQDCGYRFVVFHPDVLGGMRPVRDNLSALADDASPDYFYIDAASEAMLIFRELYDTASSGNALGTLAGCVRLVDAVSRMRPGHEAAPDGQRWQLLRQMTGYIQAHYTERISLNQIAASGAVCRNRCCLLFREGLGCTPMEYVTRYRLDKACAMLREGRPVTEAALSNGFHGVSYFSEVFKRAYHLTPREYQRTFQ